MARRSGADAQSTMAFDLHAALHYLVENGGSDLHLKAGTQPKTRIDGEMRSIASMEVLTPEDTEKAVHDMLHDPAKLRDVA